MNFSPNFSVFSCHFCQMLLQYSRVRSSRRAAATLLQNGDDLFDDRELDVFSPHKPKKFLNHWM